jgi:hypothetical protein
MKFRYAHLTVVLSLALALAAALIASSSSAEVKTQPSVSIPNLPDQLIMQTYERAAVQNVLAAVNPKVFFGYWSVCADGQGFGYGYTYPSLDGHQMTDALLWLGRVDVVKANWDYVRKFQRPDGALPIAILPNLAGKQAGEGKNLAPVAANGGLYEHWVPGNPLAALADPTYIQNADDIFRATLDLEWLKAQLPSINLSADHLESMTDMRGAVRGGGYYVERPARLDYDGVAQCHAVDAFRRAAELNRVAGNPRAAGRYEILADRIRRRFTTRFWVMGHFAEYDNPRHGLITSHGLTDTDWAAIALDVATPEQRAALWPRLKNERGFYYGGMPTGIAAHPEKYEDWEFTHADRHDLAAMGRVWLLDAQARARMGDAQGLWRGIQKVCEVGRDNGFYWRERYQPDGKGGFAAVGPNTYCEYPANLIRIVQRFLLGAEFQTDGTLQLRPTVTDRFWQKGFGQSLTWRSRTLTYEMHSGRIAGSYQGAEPQRLAVWFPGGDESTLFGAEINGKNMPAIYSHGWVIVNLPAASPQTPAAFAINRK